MLTGFCYVEIPKNKEKNCEGLRSQTTGNHNINYKTIKFA